MGEKNTMIKNKLLLLIGSGKGAAIVAGTVATVAAVATATVIGVNVLGNKDDDAAMAQNVVETESFVEAAEGNSETENKTGENVEEKDTLELTNAEGDGGETEESEAAETEEGETDEEEEDAEKKGKIEGTVFAGGTDESYESSDIDWFLNAADDEVITLVYTIPVRMQHMPAGAF